MPGASPCSSCLSALLTAPCLPFCSHPPPQALSRKLDVTGLPTVLLFCGSEGRVEQWQLPASKFDVLLAAVDRWSVPRCSLGAPPPLPGFDNVKPRKLAGAA